MELPVGPDNCFSVKFPSRKDAVAVPSALARSTGKAPACMPSAVPVGLKWPPALVNGAGVAGLHTPIE